MSTKHPEVHRTDRIGWLRAAVLGANDGIVSTASLIVGVAAAKASSGEIMVAGVAGLVAGAMSMAAGEYVSVSSQADTEQADLNRERKELAADGDFERQRAYRHLRGARAGAVARPTGRRTTHGARRIRCPRPRRAGHFRHLQRTAGTSSVGFRRDFRRWRGDAVAKRAGRTDDTTDSRRGGQFCAAAGGAGRFWCPRWRCPGDEGRLATSCSGEPWRWRSRPASALCSVRLCERVSRRDCSERSVVAALFAAPRYRRSHGRSSWRACPVV